MNRPEDPAIAAILAGARGAVARAVSAVENETAGAQALAAALAPHRGRAHVIGLTGAPGAGKSTLINALLGEWLRRGARIAVVAVDPSSPLSGGAVLGDRVRMGEHGADERVFIRSLASRGHLGGVTRTTARIVDVFDAAGFDLVIVETVGAGQSEVEVRDIADTRIVVCPPGLGDEVQAIKAGILEIADILVVNKGDSPLAERTERELKDMLGLRRASAWRVPVLRTTATTGEGVAALAESVREHALATGKGKRLAAARVAYEHGEAPGAFDAAEHVARLAARDAFVRHLGVDRAEGGRGHAMVSLRVGPQHINFHGTCHGGVIFALADTAFGLASNSHGVTAVGIDTHMTYQLAVSPGERISATASEVSRSRKLAVYRIDVTREDGALVSSFTGTVYVTTRPNLDPPPGG